MRIRMILLVLLLTVVVSSGTEWDSSRRADASTYPITDERPDFTIDYSKGSHNLVRLLAVDDEIAWRASAELIRRLPDSVPALLRGLRSRNPAIRKNCQLIIYSIGPDSADAAPVIVREIVKRRNEKDSLTPHIGQIAIISMLGPAAIPHMVELLEHDDKWFEWAVLEVMKRVKPPPIEQLPLLLEMLEDGSSYNLRYVLETIGSMGPGAKAAEEQLYDFFLDPKGPNEAHIKDNKFEVAMALSQIGADADTLLPYLNELQTDENSFKGHEIDAAIALLEGPEALVEKLRTVSRQDCYTYRENIVYLGEKTDEAVQLLIAELGTENRLYDRTIIEALARIGPDASDAVPFIIEMALEQAGMWSFSGFVTELVKIGPRDERVLDALIEILDTGSVRARRDTAYALGKMGGFAAKAIPHLEQAIKNDEKQTLRGGLRTEILSYHIRPHAIRAVAWIERDL